MVLVLHNAPEHLSDRDLAYPNIQVEDPAHHLFHEATPPGKHKNIPELLHRCITFCSVLCVGDSDIFVSLNEW